MKKFSRLPFVAALDIGTTKICCALAQPTDHGGDLQIFGIGHQVSQGVKNGQIVNIEQVTHSIIKAIHGAEHMAKQPIQEVFVNFSGKIISLRPLIKESIGGREIEEDDIHKLLNKAQNLSLKFDNKEKKNAIHCLPVYYIVDESTNIIDPAGMYGSILAVKVHLMLASQNQEHTLVKVLDKAQMDAQHIVCTPYASGLGTLVDDEMDLGAAVIDFGGGTTSMSVFKNGHCFYATTIPIGGQHISKDIAHALSTPIAQAERLKILHGSALISASDKKERLKVQKLSSDDEESSQNITKFDLNTVIQPRLDEIFDKLLDCLKDNPEVQAAARRFVLTGGGSQMPLLKKYASQRFDQQVRLGVPLGIKGLTDVSGGPSFSVCAGLLQFGVQAILSGEVQQLSALNKLKRWFKF